MALSDYPTEAVLENVRRNVRENVREGQRATVQGHAWGEVEDEFAMGNAHRFGRVIVADCLWIPEQHRNLARSVEHFLEMSDTAQVFIVAGFHSGRDRMVPFFEIVEQVGLVVDSIYEADVEGRERPFKRDRGDENVLDRKRWLAVAVLRRKDAITKRIGQRRE